MVESISGRHSAPPRWRADAAIAVACASVVVVVALWLHAAGLQSLVRGGPNAVTSIGRVVGLVASDLLLLQVFLMARIPWLERSFGQDQLVRWHRLVGLWSFWLMIVHVLVITIGYAASADTGVITESWVLTTTYPGMLLAVAGTAALVGVVGLSIRAARRRLRYESWHLLHLYAYVGVGLALPHQLWTGSEFISSPLARAYWWGSYGLCAACVLLFRVGLPIWRSSRLQLRVRKVVAEAPGVFSLHLSGRGVRRLDVQAGQFFQWRFMTGAGWSRAHPYSLSAIPRRDGLRITVKAVGDDAQRIVRARPGTRVLVEGPYGRLTASVRRQRQILLLGAGIGITPLRALLEELPYGPGEAVLAYRANTPADFALRGELDAIARRRGAAVYYLDGLPPQRMSWLPASLAHLSDSDALEQIAPGVATRDVYLCGPGPWMAAVRGALSAAGVPANQIHSEDFAW